MKIGFAAIYSWRPHVEHLYYLASLAKKDGHEIEFLTCDSDLPACYTRELRDVRPDWQECLFCRIGGVRSYESANVSSIGEYSRPVVDLPSNWKKWTYSSASSLGRFESEADFISPAFLHKAKRLEGAVKKAFIAASNWLRQKRLDAIVVFNGRIDVTRAIFEAARASKIPVATIERTWFGDGLQILPGETCLGLKSINCFVSYWKNKPLTKGQAYKAAYYIASRFLQENKNEWRAYNINAVHEKWPAAGKKKILLLPGSLNEIWGQPGWGSSWSHPIKAYDALIEHLRLDSKDLLLRAHPNWGEKIGKTDGHLAEQYYTDWAIQRNVLVIPSLSKISTLKLIEEADAVVVASGSAALEASALGKQVILVAGANYQKAGISDDATTPRKLKKVILRCAINNNKRKVIERSVRKKSLRFAYTMIYRLPQYIKSVKSVSTTLYKYEAKASSNSLIKILKLQKLDSSDNKWAKNKNGEKIILKIIEKKNWEKLRTQLISLKKYHKISRRFPYFAVDALRNIFRVGDR